VRLVWTAHEVMPPEGARWFDVLGYAMCAHAADLCICHSSQARDMLVRRFRVSPAKVVTMPIGTYFGTVPAPAGRDTTLREFGVPPDSRMLVCFGDLRPRKGVDVAAAAAGRLGRPYHLVVAGSPPAKALEPWVHEVARTCAAAPNVTIRIERLDDQLLSSLISTAECVLLPYHSILGSSALSLTLALGRAVVASDLPYFRDVLSLEPKAGVLVKPGDPWALARGIEEFFSEPIAERHAAARRIGERLAWERIIAPVGERFQALAP
jgi:glycosyltransferase involved in cell wall biosynthesis